MKKKSTSQAGERTLCPNCGHDQDGQTPTHCLSCGWPLSAQSREQRTHTPGPWKWVGTKARPGKFCYLYGAESHTVGVSLDGFTESNDNARLIAAAPELLDGCKKLLAVFDNISKRNPGYMGKLFGIDFLAMNDAFVTAEQAIHKATASGS